MASNDVSQRRIHLIAPAGSVKPFLEALGLATAAELIDLIQHIIGPDYQVTGDAKLFEAGENEARGGRRDDRHRADDIQRALADDAVVALVLIRGGAWFTRILSRIDFTVLDHRARPVAVFGFSELTTLVNIVGASRMGVGVYDMGPAFLTYGLKRHAMLQSGPDVSSGRNAAEWADRHLRPEFAGFCQDILAMIEGRGTSRRIKARVVRGRLGDRMLARFCGGNLTVLSTLVGSRFDPCVRPVGRWLVLEDFNDKVERIDRFLAHLTLADYWDTCEGLLVGDFHRGYQDQTSAVLELLNYHLPQHFTGPVLLTSQIGHVWPMSPLPLHVDLTLEQTGEQVYSIDWPADTLRTVPS